MSLLHRVGVTVAHDIASGTPAAEAVAKAASMLGVSKSAILAALESVKLPKS